MFFSSEHSVFFGVELRYSILYWLR